MRNPFIILTITILLVKISCVFAKELIPPGPAKEQPYLVDDQYLGLLTDAIVQQKQSNYSQSVSIYTEAIEYKPLLTTAYMYRGDSYKQLGKIKLAKKDYMSCIKASNHLIEFNPVPDPIMYYERGSCYYKLGDIDKADNDLTKACEGKYAFACGLKRRIYLDRTREKKWKHVSDSDMMAVYYTINKGSKRSMKSIWLRYEYYNDSKKQDIAKDTFLFKYIDEFGYTMLNVKMDCNNYQYHIGKTVYYTYDGKALHSNTTESTKMDAIVPDTDIDDVYNKICK